MSEAVPPWSEGVAKELREQGFEVDFASGFPLVKTPATLEGKVKLFKIKIHARFEIRLYAEGALFLPLP